LAGDGVGGLLLGALCANLVPCLCGCHGASFVFSGRKCFSWVMVLVLVAVCLAGGCLCGWLWGLGGLGVGHASCACVGVLGGGGRGWCLVVGVWECAQWSGGSPAAAVRRWRVCFRLCFLLHVLLLCGCARWRCCWLVTASGSSALCVRTRLPACVLPWGAVCVFRR